MLNNLLSVKKVNISLKSKEFPIVKDVSFHLEKGEMLGIIGKSGSGKTTLVMGLAQLLSTQVMDVRGDLWLSGKNFSLRSLAQGSSKNQRFVQSHFGIIFQNAMSVLDPYETIEFQICEILKQKNIPSTQWREETVNILAKVGLREDANIIYKYPHQLSGGMKQRIVLAMAILQKPKILIADEPTSALDAVNQLDFVRHLKKVSKEEGMSVIFVSHDISLVSYVCKRILVMNEGEIVESGHHELLNFPQSLITKKIIADTKKLLQVPKEKPFSTPPHYEIIASHLSKEYQGKKTKQQALHQVSLKIASGEIYTLVGASGSGKTTLASILIGLTDKSSGYIEVFQQDVGDLTVRKSKAYRKNIQMVRQNSYHALDPKQSVLDTFLEALLVNNIVSTKEEALALVKQEAPYYDLSFDHLHKRPHGFSGGQLQRICLMRSLLLRPKILIADEVISSLDVGLQVQILDLILKIQRERDLTCLFITHNIHSIGYFSNRIGVLKDGELVEETHVYDFFSSPKSTYAKELVHAIRTTRLKD